MIISFELPRDIEREIAADGTDLSGEACEAYLVELYRQDRITHRQLGEALGLSRYETDGLLKRHRVSPSISAQETREQARALEDARPG